MINMIFNIYLFYLAIDAVILTGLFLYMQRRIAVLIDEQKRRVYAPNMLKSLIEILVFLAVYFVCGVIATLPNIDLDLAAGASLLAFLLSLFLVNKTVYKNLGRYTVVYSAGIMTLYFGVVAYINTMN